MANGGAGLRALAQEIEVTCARAHKAGVSAPWIASLQRAVGIVGSLSSALAQRGLSGDVEGMMLHATDYLDLMSTVVIAWQWIELAAVAHEALAGQLPRGHASCPLWPR